MTSLYNKGIAMYKPHPDGYYIPANIAANAACSVISNRFPRDKDMLTIRAKGWTPCLTNGQEIGRVDERA
jgi:hypothetical protein